MWRCHEHLSFVLHRRVHLISSQTYIIRKWQSFASPMLHGRALTRQLHVSYLLDASSKHEFTGPVRIKTSP